MPVVLGLFADLNGKGKIRYYFAEGGYGSNSTSNLVFGKPALFLRPDRNDFFRTEVVNILLGKAGGALKDESIPDLGDPVHCELLLLDFLNLPKF